MAAAVVLAGAVVLVAAPSPALAVSRQTTPAPPPAPSVALARLAGTFLLAGQVTVAKNIAGEHAGENVLRTWTFTSACPAGACASVQLVRQRPHATDTVLLYRQAQGYYVGQGTFYAPLRCAGRTYLTGERVPFTIAVRVTQAVLVGGIVLAARVMATYANRSRTSLTLCVSVPGHDSARYHGHLVTPTAPA